MHVRQANNAEKAPRSIRCHSQWCSSQHGNGSWWWQTGRHRNSMDEALLAVPGIHLFFRDPRVLYVFSERCVLIPGFRIVHVWNCLFVGRRCSGIGYAFQHWHPSCLVAIVDEMSSPCLRVSQKFFLQSTMGHHVESFYIINYHHFSQSTCPCRITQLNLRRQIWLQKAHAHHSITPFW